MESIDGGGGGGRWKGRKRKGKGGRAEGSETTAIRL